MLTGMGEADWATVLTVFNATRSRRGDKGRNDRRFLEALKYFVVHNITWRALPIEYGHWNSVWKRFWRLSRTGFFEAFFEALAENSETAHLFVMFDSTVVRGTVVLRSLLSLAHSSGSKPSTRPNEISVMGSQVKITAVIVTYNRRSRLENCLSELCNQSLLPDKIIVVDNGSADETKLFLSNLILPVPLDVIYLDMNVGGAGGFSLGIQKAVSDSADFIWVMDDDAYPEPNCLMRLKKAIIDKKAVCVCPLIIGTSGIPQLYHHKKVDAFLNESPAIMEGEGGHIHLDANSFVGPLFRADCVSRVGLPQAEFFIWYDDTEFTMRLSRIGSVLLCTEATIYHEDYHAGSERFLDWKMLYGTRNKYWVARKSGNALLYFYATYVTLRWMLVMIVKFEDSPGKFFRMINLFVKLIHDVHKERLDPFLFKQVGTVCRLRGLDG